MHSAQRFSCCCFLLASSPFAGGFEVLAVSPAQNALGAATATPIAVRFSADVDAASLTGTAFSVYGRWSGVVDGTLVTSGDELSFTPARPLFPGEMVSVMLSNAVESTAGAGLASGFGWQFWTRSVPGSGAFSLVDVIDLRLSGEGLIQSYGIYAGDLDRDGSPDFSIPNEVSSDVRTLLNDGCGGFSAPVPHALPPFSFPSSNEGGDFDGDGFIDLATANIFGDATSVLLGDGAGGYEAATTYSSGDEPRGLTLLDANADGALDIALASRDSSDVSLHLGVGDGSFLSATSFEGGGSSETSIAAIDADSDGVWDLFVGHYDSQTLSVLLGDGTGAFANSATAGCGGRPWMIATGDVDGDGDVDVASANSNNDNAGLLRGDNAGGLAGLQTYPVGNFPLAVDLGDADGDGDLDLALSNYQGGTWTLYRNDGMGSYGNPTTLAAAQAGSCLTIVDADRDGDMDLCGIDEIVDQAFLFAQGGPVHAGVQPGSCDATLRIDNLAGSRGFGGTPSHPVALGQTSFLGLSGGASVLYLVAIGAALEPGVDVGFGLLNLNAPTVVASGVTDTSGEVLIPFALSTSLPVGGTLAVQGLLASPAGGAASNPERMLFTL